MIKLNKNETEADEHFLKVKSLIQTRITSVIRIGRIGRAPNTINLTANITAFLNGLLDDNQLSDLIKIAPENIPGVIAGLSAMYPQFIIPKSKENLILRNVFISHGYDNVKFDKHEFIRRINIDTCPYCNRNYVYYLSKKSEIKPQIDHFFPKTQFPFLALSFYNLIPSCQTCNGFGAKEEKDPAIVNLINPYLLEHHNFRFTYKVNNINFLNPLLDKSSITVKFLHSLQGHLDVFKLEELYAQHADHVLELVIKSKIAYSEEYRKYLSNYTGLKFSDAEIDRMILGNYSKEEEIYKRPLAKLYRDVGKDLGLIL